MFLDQGLPAKNIGEIRASKSSLRAIHHDRVSEEARGDEMAESEVLNTAELLNRLDGDRELLAELIDVFLPDAEGMLQCVSEAVARQDATAVGRAAHKIKGSLSIFSSSAATETAQLLETMGRNQDLSLAREVLAQLEQQVERLKKALIELKETPCPKS